MLKKITIIFCFFFFLLFNGLSLATERNDKNLLTFGVGIWDWNDEKTAGLFNVGYRHGKRYGPFKPMVGGLINTDHGFHVYAGIRIDLYLTDKIVITPSFAPGFYEKGDGKELGHIIEFRSGLDLAYRRKNTSTRFSPQYIVYYNLQSIPCIYVNSKDALIYHAGQMEWGYEHKKKRWLHLRKLD